MGLWPICFLLITIISLKYEKYSVYSVKILEDEQNVGTVLFDKSSAINHCWTNEEFVILSSRKIFQDLLPQIETLNIQTDQYIADLLSYFHMCLEYVCNMSVGKTKQLTLKSLTDLLGGYLYSYVVPITKVSFYAENVKYENTKKIIALLDELKNFLHTNGAGWKKPMEMKMFINVTPIAVAGEGTSDACNELILNFTPQSTSSARNFHQQQRYHLRKRRFSSRYNDFEDDSVNHQNLQESFRMYLPYLDNNVNPNSIALPFKNHNLWSLYEEESVSILSKYYETCVRCISSMKNYERNLDDFNKDIYKWLLDSVYPRLSDDKWYPAFGGVLKMILYLRDIVETEELKTVIGVKPTTVTYKTVEIVITTSKPNEEVDDTAFGTTELITIAVSSALLVWLLVGLCLVCYRYLCKHSDERSHCESTISDVAMLYKNNGFCEMDTCPSTNSQKSVGVKIREWWEQKFKTCPGGCDDTLEKERCLASINYGSKPSVSSNKGRRSYKKRKKKVRSVSVSASPSSSPCIHYGNRKYYYSSDVSSSDSESFYR